MLLRLCSLHVTVTEHQPDPAAPKSDATTVNDRIHSGYIVLSCLRNKRKQEVREENDLLELGHLSISQRFHGLHGRVGHRKILLLNTAWPQLAKYRCLASMGQYLLPFTIISKQNHLPSPCNALHDRPNMLQVKQ